MDFIINDIKFIKSKMQIIAYMTLNYALNLNVLCFSFCNSMQILISVVFLNLHVTECLPIIVVIECASRTFRTLFYLELFRTLN